MLFRGACNEVSQLTLSSYQLSHKMAEIISRLSDNLVEPLRDSRPPRSDRILSVYGYMYTDMVSQWYNNTRSHSKDPRIDIDYTSFWWLKLRSWVYVDGLVQEIRNSIADALELHLSCNSPSISSFRKHMNWHNFHHEKIKLHMGICSKLGNPYCYQWTRVGHYWFVLVTNHYLNWCQLAIENCHDETLFTMEILSKWVLLFSHFFRSITSVIIHQLWYSCNTSVAIA